MKKIFLGLSAAVMLSMSVGCNGSSAAGSNGNDSTATENAALGDSVGEAFGEMQAIGFLQYYQSLPDEEKAKFSKDDLIKGFKEMLMADTTNQGFQIGQNMGMQMLGKIMQIERQSDVRIDRKKVLDAFTTALKQDSVSAVEMQGVQMRMQGIQMQLSQAMQAFRNKQVMSDPAVQKTIKAGEDYIAAKVKADPEIKKTSSGLYYKVEKTGNGQKVDASKSVKINYVGKLTNDTIFDQNKGVEMNPNGVIPGFKEGLLMMDKGAKYTFYIPGNLAYGEQGIPGKIAPMETLVFEVEVLDIVEPKQAAAPGAPAATKK